MFWHICKAKWFPIIAFLFAVPLQPVVAGPPAVSIELNKLEPGKSACRAYLILKNTTPHHFDSLKLDLVMFDRDGVVAKRLAVEGAPLRPSKTSLKVFDIDGRSCETIGSILLNDVLACQGLQDVPDDCLALVELSARGGVPFIK